MNGVTAVYVATRVLVLEGILAPMVFFLYPPCKLAWKALTTRTLSTITSSATVSLNNSIYVSKSTNPYFNLTFEDWFVL